MSAAWLMQQILIYGKFNSFELHKLTKSVTLIKQVYLIAGIVIHLTIVYIIYIYM